MHVTITDETLMRVCFKHFRFYKFPGFHLNFLSGCGTLSEREKLIELVEALKLIERTDLGRDLLGQSDLARQLLGTSDLGRRIGQGLRLPGTGSPQDMKHIVHPEHNPNPVSAPAFDTW